MGDEYIHQNRITEKATQDILISLYERKAMYLLQHTSASQTNTNGIQRENNNFAQQLKFKTLP